MSAVKNVARNTTWLFISYAVSSFFNFFYNMYTARYLDKNGYGELNFAIAFAGIFNVLADMGISALATREVARNEKLAYSYFDGAVKVKTVLSAITFALILVIAKIKGYPDSTLIVIAFIALGNLINSFSMLLCAVFQAFEKMEYQSLGGIIYSAMNLAGALYLISHNMDIIAFATLYLGTNALLIVFYIAVCNWKFFAPILSARTDWDMFRSIIREGWPMGAMALSVMIFSRVDTVMLEFMRGSDSVGLYSAAYKLSDLSTVVAVMFTSAVYPIIARFYQSSQSSFKYTYNKSMKFLFYIAVPMAFTVTLLANTIITLYYKGSFAGSIVALQVLIWGAVAVYLTMVSGNTMITANMQRLQMKLVMALAIVNIALNYAFISLFDYVGSAVVMVITQWLCVFLYAYYLNRSGYRLNLKEIILPPALGLLAMAVTTLALAGMGVSLLIVVPVDLLEYMLIILALGIKKDDIDLVKNVFNLKA